MSQTLAGITIGLLVLSVIFGLLERLFPGVAGRPLARAGLRTDLVYWLVTPLLAKPFTHYVIVATVVVVAIVIGAPLGKGVTAQYFAERQTWVTGQPLWLQTLEAFFLGDLVGYFTHRWFHRSRLLWPIHAVHHSSTELDWLSSVRVHPLNDVLPRVIQVAAILALGFPPRILAAYVPALTLYAILLHANVSWTFGPLRYVIASPAFHRWHHTTEGMGKNLAGFFPAIDLAFGTFHMPEGRTPAKFGIPSSSVPEGFLAQLAHPFVGRKRPERRVEAEAAIEAAKGVAPAPAPPVAEAAAPS